MEERIGDAPLVVVLFIILYKHYGSGSYKTTALFFLLNNP